MFLKYLARRLHFAMLAGKNEAQKVGAPGEESGEGDVGEAPDPKLTDSLQENLDALRQLMGDSNDLKIHTFRFGEGGRRQGALFFIDGLVSNEIMMQGILLPMMNWRFGNESLPKGRELAETLAGEVLCVGDIQVKEKLGELVTGCLSGDTAILLDDCDAGLVVSSKGWDKRSVSEPQSETVVRGPREGFTENLRTNTSLIRRKIRSEQLRIENLVIGRKTQTNISLIYLDGVVNQRALKEIRYRIQSLEVDSILESGYLEEYIGDAPFSPFSTIGGSEKPDVVASRLLEGRVAVLVDGTPYVLTAPLFFVECFQTAEDYYVQPLYATAMRLLRYAAYFITVFGPAIYIALTDFHPELLPTTLLFTIANAREGTPFPVFIEALIMEFTYEILREAGIRLPRPVGQAISIVGALVMGDAAVSAGLVGTPVVITIAITAVSGFLVPSLNESSTLLRVPMMVLAATLGWYGISMGFLAVLLHLGSLNSFGSPYFDGLSWTRNLQDSVVRMPLWTMVKRPEGIAEGDITRRRFFVPPLRPYEKKDEDEEA